ncbi:MAG: restriction endonuclease [Tepidisphaeraceae bacterium]|jgi:HJR/Mrr/RecB family endonuclease
MPEIDGGVAAQQLAVAELELIAARTTQDAAVKQLSRAGWTLKYHRTRLWASRRGVPSWVLGLVAGSLASLFLGAILIFGFGISLVLVPIELLVGYVICGGVVLWIFRDLNGENELNRLQVRTEQVALSEENRLAAIEAVRETMASVDNAQRHGKLLREALQSESYKHQVETNRLLGIDAGRLYPDEFERYIGDIFRHLGFTIEVTGRSGDQGVDVLACRGPLRIAIQAKRYIGSVSNSAVQEVYAGMAHHKCHRCAVVTTGEFTAGAIALAQSTGCFLIGADKIGLLIRGQINF